MHYNQLTKPDLGPIPDQKEVLRKHLCYTPEGELDMTGADWDYMA